MHKKEIWKSRERKGKIDWEKKIKKNWDKATAKKIKRWQIFFMYICLSTQPEMFYF